MKAAYFQGLAGIWAGVSLGGALIAAPAKFQVEALTLPVALQVGQAQFGWLWICEGVLALMFLGAVLANRQVWWAAIAAPMVLFAVQMVGIVPTLDARTERAIAGEVLEPSHLHLVFVALEVLKFLSLAAVAVGLATREGR
ncbi:MAG: hypothetical protein AAGA87_13770 [Pseudomonadota bacterium]